MHIKVSLQYLLLQSLDNYKVCLSFIVLSVTVCTVGYICLFRVDQTFVDIVSFLSLIIYEVLYTRCIKNSNLRKEVGITIKSVKKQVVSSNQLEIAM